MEQISRVPVELVNIIPVFSGDSRQLPLFLKKCEYILERFGGNELQNEYLFHLVTSRLSGEAATLVGEREQIINWQELKTLLSQHFGDPRTEECLVLELEALRIRKGENYLEFCHRVQNLRSILLSKVNETIDDINVRRAKQSIYTNSSMNVFLYNLPAYLVRLVRLRNVSNLEDALKVVLEEQNFQTVYDHKNRQSNNNIRNPRPSPPQNGYQSFRQIDNRQSSTPVMNRSQNSNFNRSFHNSSQSNNFNNNYNSRNNSFQSRNFNGSYNSRNTQQQMFRSMPGPSQQFTDNAPRNMSSSHFGSGNNTDVTMRTASSRRINYTDNNLENINEYENSDVPLLDPVEQREDIGNFCLMASPIGRK
jgi:hypothetical protein